MAIRMLVLALGSQQVKGPEQPYKGARIDSNITDLLNILISTQGALNDARQFLYVFLLSRLTLGWMGMISS